MRKTILTIGFYIICLSVFSFCTVPSFATPSEDAYPQAALDDLDLVEDELITRKTEVLEAWTVVDSLTAKWDAMTDKNRRKTVTNFLVESVGTGFWALTAGLDDRLEAELKEYYSNKSLMDLYSDELERLKGRIDLFYAGVPIYKSAHKTTVRIVDAHKLNHHNPESPSSMALHNVPSLKKKTCRDDLPSFSCRGNHAAGKTVCNESYNTPSKAYYTHREVCGEEVDDYGNKTLISGDGNFYYTCDTEAYDKHRVRTCTRDFTNASGVTETCGDSFRRCVGPKKDHDWSNFGNWKTKHSDESDVNDDDDDDDTSEVVDNSPNCDYCTGSCSACTQPSTPTYHVCGVHETSVSGDHSMQASCLETNGWGHSCTVSAFYACQSHTHTFPTFSCGRAACTEQVADPEEHRRTCIHGEKYWSCNTTSADHHRTYICTRYKPLRQEWNSELQRNEVVWGVCGESWSNCHRGLQTCRNVHGAIKKHQK